MDLIQAEQPVRVANDRRAFVIMAIFFAQALTGGSLTTRIADFQSNLGLSESVLGLALLGAAISGLLIYLVSGRIVEAYGTRDIFLWCLPAIAVSTWLHAVAPGPVSLFLAGFLFGIPWSVFNVAMNVEADRYEAETGERIMNRCHGWWSAGLLLTALIAVWARGVNLSPSVHFAMFFPVALIAVLVLVRPMRAAPVRPTTGQATRRMISWPTVSVAVLVAFGLAGGFGQITSQNWSVIYMRDSFDAPDWIDTLSLSAFLLFMTAGRLFADGWSARFGAATVTVFLTATALAGSVAVTVAPVYQVALLGFALIGLGVSSLYPVMISAAARLGDRSASDNVAAVNLLTGLAMLVAPPLVGFVAEGFGIRQAFGLLVPFLIVTIVLTRRACARS